jgi:hypothetical protein
MNDVKIQDYINSGVIEDYCLGVLNVEEIESGDEAGPDPC